MAFVAARIIAAAFLIGALPQRSLTYYAALRVFISCVAAFGAFSALRAKRPLRSLFFAALLTVFNPIVVLKLSRSSWQRADIAVALLLLASLFL